MEIVYEPDGSRPVCEQFPVEFLIFTEQLKSEKWAEKLTILDHDSNRSLTFLAFDDDAVLRKTDPISVYNLKRLTVAEMIRLVRTSLRFPTIKPEQDS